MHCEIIDLNTGNHKNILFDYSDLNSKLFCINDDKVVVAVAHQYITILDMNTGASLSCTFQRYLARNFLIQTKLSPNGTVLAFPKVNGDMEFLRLSILQDPLLPSIKDKAAFEWSNFMEEFIL